jgi:hypothetical protein
MIEGGVGGRTSVDAATANSLWCRHGRRGYAHFRPVRRKKKNGGKGKMNEKKRKSKKILFFFFLIIFVFPFRHLRW